MPKFDFAGWATRNNLKCSDGRTIMKDAFKDQDNTIVPLVWNHQHDTPDNVLGHALLKNEAEGVRAYCTFNDTESGKEAKKIVGHGDIVSLSIWANGLKQKAGNVLHGAIREVSLVLAGANPGAYIDDIAFAHGEDETGEAVIFTGVEEISMYDVEEQNELEHADKDGETKEAPAKGDDKEDDGEETVGDIINSMNEKQRNVLEALVGQALSEGGGDSDNDEEGSEMKHNVFETETQEESNVLSHSDMEEIFRNAKRVGSLREAVEE